MHSVNDYKLSRLERKHFYECLFLHRDFPPRCMMYMTGMTAAGEGRMVTGDEWRDLRRSFIASVNPVNPLELKCGITIERMTTNATRTLTVIGNSTFVRDAHVVMLVSDSDDDQMQGSSITSKSDGVVLERLLAGASKTCAVISVSHIQDKSKRDHQTESPHSLSYRDCS